MFQKTLSFSFCILIVSAFVTHVFADEPVTFDIPAITSCIELEDSSQSSKLIEVVVPVSVLVKDSESIELEQLLVAIYWSSGANLVTDFAPRTTLSSDIEGTVSIQKSNDQNGSIGVDTNGGYSNIVGVNARGQLGGSKSESTSFHVKPKQELLAASGQIKRGTGTYFKFRSSSQTTLEGTHDLLIQFRVPHSWRAGLLRVDCQVLGKRGKSVSLDNRKFKNGMEFITAICMPDDVAAFELAAEYVRLEGLLSSLKRKDEPKQKSEGLFAQISGWMGNDGGQESRDAENDWYRQVVYAYSDTNYQRIRDRLPRQLKSATNEFVAARKKFTSLNR